MGYWGYLIVGRSARPLAETDALRAVRDGLTSRERRDDGWQVWEYPSGGADIGNMNTLALETGAPALFGYVMDSHCVVLEAAAPESGAWTTCLARDAMAGYLGAGQSDGGESGSDASDEGLTLTLDDYFLEPGDAAERAVDWAAEAGHTVNAGPLLDVLTSEPDPLAENLFFRFLDRLGVLPL
ncbi:hypothetical protein ACKI1I_18600 [Streptomyces turgidiscabies]|uniref:Uncharacterized protein n=1 Tax=Streptomyces turgidiscabies (strain Car8) TaxID=698760 RepID=L7EQF2_STRT8|nr:MULTISPECIES: hypothetical protein [Streptomyces]ELP61673.1 hypothetical protein STRTUCAR8_06972 [Streptomyces turgidiscabies Car8]MDX3497873.1 hypothetical protein [Streptomyces turgidiscabies]GAQ69779.1 hypothetical protein T45_01510 [Streptomyces turgidiscabies]